MERGAGVESPEFAMNARRCGVLLSALVVVALNMVACRWSKEAESEMVTPPPTVSPSVVEKKPAVFVKTKKVAEVPEKQEKPELFVPKNPGIRISRVSVPDKLVALTFDDGPHGVLTPRILDILDRYGARCTFFVLGKNVSLYPHVVRRASLSGHEIGNHSWSHPKLTRLSHNQVFSELSRTNEAIRRATGKTPALMRPPYGAINAPLLHSIYANFGTSAVMWDVDTNDWRKPGVQTVINRAVNGAKSGSVILVHDIHASTADAVEGIVRGLQARGFRLVTVSELLSAARQAVGASGEAGLTRPVTSEMRSASVPIENGAKPNLFPISEEKSTGSPYITVPTLESPRPQEEMRSEGAPKLRNELPASLPESQMIPTL